MNAMSDVRQTIRDVGASAVAALERVDAGRPSQAEPLLNEAVEHLVRLRDELIGHRRGGEDCGEWLGRVNGLLSGIFGVEYPAGGIHWQQVVKTREDLRDMLGSLDESVRHWG